ncbi:MAG: hypothetical protein JJU13_21310 [Balneolaceae bacterium]|nr:hypothetical protein [Balneolaceae bacterium]
MKHIAGKLTDTYLQKLSSERQYYSLDDLLTSGFPKLLVERIKFELKKNLRHALKLPETEWANIKVVSARWDLFVSEAEKEIRLPASYARGVIEQALVDCISMSVQPRSTIPDLIFQDDSTITQEKISERIAPIVINRHLAEALGRYMDKKDKKSLTKEQARNVVAAIDDRLVADYHPLKWMELLSPLFRIAGPDVDSGLLNLFFEEKKRKDVALKLSKLNKAVGDTELIEILSSTEQLEIDDKAENQPALFDDKPGTEPGSTGEVITGIPENVDRESDADGKKAEEVPKKEIEKEENESEEKALNEWFLADDGDREVTVPWQQQEEEDNEVAWPEFSIIPGKVTEEDEPEVNDHKEEKSKESIRKDQPEKEEPSSASPELSNNDDEDDEPLLNRFIFDEAVPDQSEDENESKTIYDELRLVRDEEPEERTISLFDDYLGRDEDDNEDEEPESKPVPVVNKKKETEIPAISETKKPAEETKASAEIELEEELEEDPFGIEKTPGEGIKEGDEEEEDKEDTPMWRSFLQRSDADEEPSFQFDEEYEEGASLYSEEEDSEELSYSVFGQQDFTSEEDQLIDALSDWMGDDKEKYVKNLFNGSDVAYERAILDIMEFENWKSASKYLENQVFKRNRLDVFDETAVDFTDRLHSYFKKYKD